MNGYEILVSLGVKFIGALIGGILALLIIPPKSMTEAGRRLSVAVLTGMSAAGALFALMVSRMGLSGGLEDVLLAALIAGYLAWWVLGAMPKAVRRFITKEIDDA